MCYLVRLLASYMLSVPRIWKLCIHLNNEKISLHFTYCNKSINKTSHHPLESCEKRKIHWYTVLSLPLRVGYYKRLHNFYMHILNGWKEWLSINMLVFSNLLKVRYFVPGEEKIPTLLTLPIGPGKVDC